MDEWSKKQLTILGAIAVLAVIVGGALGVNWTGRLWAARYDVGSQYEADCENADTDCAQKDLPAQVRSARAAEAMTDISIWQLGIGTAGLIGVSLSLIFNAQAVSAAVRQIAHSEDNAKAAWAAVKNNRAWVMPNAMDTATITDARNDETVTIKNGFGFIPKIINRGASPALEVGVARDFKIVSVTDAAPTFENLSPSPQAILSPGETGTSNPVFLSDSETASFRLGLTVVYIAVFVTYRDTYEPEKLRITNFIYSAHHDGGTREGPDGIVKESISMTFAGEQTVT